MYSVQKIEKSVQKIKKKNCTLLYTKVYEMAALIQRSEHFINFSLFKTGTYYSLSENKQENKSFSGFLGFWIIARNEHLKETGERILEWDGKPC